MKTLKITSMTGVALALVFSNPANAATCYDQTVAAMGSFWPGGAQNMTPDGAKKGIQKVGVSLLVEKVSVKVEEACRPFIANNANAYAGFGQPAEPAPQPTPTPSSEPSPVPSAAATAPAAEATPAAEAPKADPAVAARQQQLKTEQAALVARQRELEAQQNAQRERIAEINKRPQLTKPQHDELKKLVNEEQGVNAQLEQVRDRLSKVETAQRELHMQLYGRMEKNAKGEWELARKGDIPQLQEDVAAIKSGNSGFMAGLSWWGGLIFGLLILVGIVVGVVLGIRRLRSLSEEPAAAPTGPIM